MAGAPPRRIRTGPADISRLMRKKIMTRCRMIGSVQQVAILRTSAAAVALAPLLAACGNTVGVNSPPVTTRTVTTTESPTTPLPRIVPKVSNCGIQKPTVKPTELIIFLTHLSPLPSSGQSRPSGSQPCRSTPRKGSPCPIRTAIIQPAASCGTFYTGVVYPSSSADYCTVALAATSNRVQSGTPGRHRHRRPDLADTRVPDVELKALRGRCCPVLPNHPGVDGHARRRHAPQQAGE
jgi:hypothetical protein